MRRLALLALLLAPAFTAPGVQGLQPVSEAGYGKLLEANKGSVLLVDFWATWCAPCREEMPHIVRLLEKYQARGLRLATISCDEPEEQAGAAQFLQQHRVPEPRYLKKVENDEKLINVVDRKWSGALPALFLYDREGRLVKAFVGETNLADLEKVIQKLL